MIIIIIYDNIVIGNIITTSYFFQVITPGCRVTPQQNRKITMLKTNRCKELLKDLEQRGVTALWYSDRNKKLVPNGSTAFLIWNLQAVVTCPYATPHCKAACYARKAEKAYPDCLPRRMANFEDSRRADFAERMLYTILKRRNGCRKSRLIVRIHESGDFYNKAYAAAWLYVAEQCKGEDITFIAYTKSFRFFDGVKLPYNFRLRAYVWDDTIPEQLAIIERNGWPIYTAVDKFRKGDKFFRCRCKDCATCGQCWTKRPVIACEIH